MKWEEFTRKGFSQPIIDFKKLTDIECPNCGTYVYKDTSIVLTSNPPQYYYECLNCGWKGTWF